jgi:hypothetical protein
MLDCPTSLACFAENAKRDDGAGCGSGGAVQGWELLRLRAVGWQPKVLPWFEPSRRKGNRASRAHGGMKPYVEQSSQRLGR